MSAGNEFLQKRVQKFTWDQSVDGDLSNNASTSIGTLPKGALITGGAIYVETDVVDNDAGDDQTVSFGYTGATTAFQGATAVSGLETGTLLSLLPGNFALDGNALTAANMAIARDDTYILLGDNKEVLLTTGDDVAIDEGKIHVFVEYYMAL